MRTSGISNVQGRGQAQLSKMELTISVVYFSREDSFLRRRQLKFQQAWVKFLSNGQLLYK